jgi:hypothetical protein
MHTFSHRLGASEVSRSVDRRRGAGSAPRHEECQGGGALWDGECALQPTLEGRYILSNDMTSRLLASWLQRERCIRTGYDGHLVAF